MMTDSEEQNDELLALSEILERTDFLCSKSEEGLNTGVMSVTVNLAEDSGLQVGSDGLMLVSQSHYYSLDKHRQGQLHCGPSSSSQPQLQSASRLPQPLSPLSGDLLPLASHQTYQQVSTSALW